MVNPLLRTLAASLAGSLSEQKISRAFAALPALPLANFPAVDEGIAPVCALQVKARVYSSLGAMVRDIDRYMAAAAKTGARLVCFPELYGLFTAFASPLVRSAFKGGAHILASGKEGSAGPSALPYLPPLYEPFAFLPERYLSIMGRLARRYGVWVSCGSVFTWEGGKIYNRHTLLDDTGRVAGTQDKLHLVPEEAAMGLSTGETLTVVTTPFGRVALTVCMDATYFETFRVAKALGADFALVPIANMEPYDYHLALRGAAMRVTETNLAAVKPALVAGKRFPLQITGRAGVYYPLGLAQKSRETTHGNRPAALTAHIDLAALRRFVPEGFCLENRAFGRETLRQLTMHTQKNAGNPAHNRRNPHE